MVFFIAIPALASTSENENAPAVVSEDQQFMGLTTLSEEELMEIIGLIAIDDVDGSNTFNPITQIGTTSDGKKFKIIKEYTIKKDALFFLAGIYLLSSAISASDISQILKSIGIIGSILSFSVVKELITITLLGGGIIFISLATYDIIQNGLYTYQVVYINNK